MGFFSTLYNTVLAFVVVFFGILLGPNPLPKTASFTEFKVPPIKNLGEGFAENNLLNNAERLFEGEIKGPESFEVLGGKLYTTLHGGFVARVAGHNKIIPVVQIGEPCSGWWEESKCGRPLGIKIYDDEDLLIADAYYGICRIDPISMDHECFVDHNSVVSGKTPKIFNGVEVTKGGIIYWTHSSSDFTLQDGIFAFLADGSGRLVEYDPSQRKNVVLLKNLFFPNGLVLSPDEDYLLVAETGKSRILKYHLKGPKKHTSEVFLDGLPGVPDNLRRIGDKYYVPLVVTASKDKPLLFQMISSYPSVRKFTARFLSFIELFFQKIDKIYSNYYTKRAVHFIGHLESFGLLFSKKTILLEVDSNGKVLRSFHGSDGTVTSVSDVIPYKGYLYFGSPSNNYLARIELSKLGIKTDESAFMNICKNCDNHTSKLEDKEVPSSSLRQPTTTQAPPLTTTQTQPTLKPRTPTTKPNPENPTPNQNQ